MQLNSPARRRTPASWSRDDERADVWERTAEEFSLASSDDEEDEDEDWEDEDWDWEDEDDESWGDEGDEDEREDRTRR